MLETGNFSDKRLMKTHNWFGFRPNGRGFQNGVKQRYGTYATGEAMLADYREWEMGRVIRHALYSETEFRQWVYTHYAEDGDYQGKLIQKLNFVRQ